MNLQTFKAATMAEALTQVKTTMGADAVILHTRTFYTRHWLGLRRREMVEITAGKGLNVGRRRFVAEPQAQAQRAIAAAGASANTQRLPANRAGLAAYRSSGTSIGSAGPTGGTALASPGDSSAGDSF